MFLWGFYLFVSWFAIHTWVVLRDYTSLRAWVHFCLWDHMILGSNLASYIQNMHVSPLSYVLTSGFNDLISDQLNGLRTKCQEVQGGNFLHNYDIFFPVQVSSLIVTELAFFSLPHSPQVKSNLSNW